jgi:Flp pilus assembly protein TadD
MLKGKGMKKLTIISAVLALVISVSCEDSALKYYNLGVEAAEREDIDIAIEYWRKASELNPEDPDIRYNLGMALLEKKEYVEAEENFHAAAKIKSDDYMLQYGLGRSLEMQGKFSEAKKAYRFSINLKSNYHPPYAGLGAIALQQDLYSTAEKYATDALRYSPHDTRGNLVLAEAYYMQQNHQAAYAQLISSRAWIGLEPDYLLLLGKVMNARHMYEDARHTLLMAKDAGKSGTDLYLNLGIASFEIDDLKNANEYYRLAIYRDATNVEAWTGLARTEYEMGDLDGSLEAWNKAKALSPEDPEIDLGTAMVNIRTRKFEEAVSILEKLNAKEDSPPRTLYYLGHSLMRLGRRDEARKAFEEFLDRWQGDKALIDEVEEILVTL